MRAAAKVAVRAAVFVAVWLALPRSPASSPAGDGGEWLLFVVLALVALLWGVLDGLLAERSLTAPLLRWAATAPVAAVALAVLDRSAATAWPGTVDTLRGLVLLTLMFYSLMVLPAGLGAAIGAGVQQLQRSLPRG